MQFRGIVVPLQHQNQINKNNMDFRMQDRMELKALVDFYATESDKNNQ